MIIIKDPNQPVYPIRPFKSLNRIQEIADLVIILRTYYYLGDFGYDPEYEMMFKDDQVAELPSA